MIPPNITHGMADAWFTEDTQAAVNAVNQKVSVPLSQNQFDALVDFTYNEGVGNFSGSTLLRKLNQGDYAGAEAEFQKWVYSGGQRNSNLVNRRYADAQLFNSGPSYG